MKPMYRDGIPFCSLTCDELRDGICTITQRAVTTKLTEYGVPCRPAVGEMAHKLSRFTTNPGHTLLRTALYSVQDNA